MFQSMLTIVGMILFSLTMIFPDALGIAPGVIGSAMFITTSVTWGGKETYDYFLRPMFVGKSPWETQGIRVIPNVQSTLKLNYFGTANKILKAYAKGFSAAAGATYTQRTLTTVQLKAEAADDASAFYQTVFESLRNKTDWNDLTGTELDQIIIGIYRRALESDIYRIFWLGDPYKETVTTTFQTGVADTNYNMLTGMWKLIFDNCATSPSDTQIKRIAVSDGAAAQVQTVTLTGTSGTCNVAIDGINYLATFPGGGSITTTNDAFRLSWGAALLLRGYAMTGTATIIVTATKVGQPAATITVSAAVTGDLTGSVAATTPNTAPVALAAGESEDTLLSLFEGCDVVLKNIPTNEKVFLVDRLVYENYQTYLETLSTVTANSKLENGVTMLTYRGIPVIPMEWGLYLNADFPHLTGSLPAYPHRIIYTQIGNLALGFDTMNQYTETARWYNKDEEENRFRAKLVMGVQYVHNKLMAVAY